MADDFRPDTEKILAGLKDFQQQTVEYVFNRLYLDENPGQRFLIADEVGLGKTLVAKGVIAKAIDYLWDKTDRIDVIYICSNREIATQNVNRLNITANGFAISSRITLLPLNTSDLNKNKVNLITLTPGTSFNLRSSCGIVTERAFLYNILRQEWGFGSKAGPLNLFQAGAGRDNWRREAKNFRISDCDSDLVHGFVKALEKKIKQAEEKGETDLKTRFEYLVERFGFSRKHYPLEDRIQRNAFIGELRTILAASCIRALRPNIVILDEFQRFKYLMDGEDQMSQLAQELFEYQEEDREVKIILLSATPYKMYTIHQEAEEEDHYQDFIRTLKFLFNSEEITGKFTGLLKEYRKGLYQIATDGLHKLEETKTEIEKLLRQVMSRTERLSVSSDRNAMIREAANANGKLKGKDLEAFITVDKVAREIDAGDHTEYWKSAPYILNFMDKYMLKNKFKQHVDSANGNLADILHEGMHTMLSWPEVSRYRKIDPQNFKLRQIIEQNVGQGWRYLWVPPAQPYYEPRGVYADGKAAEFTKSIVFSAWKVVPKVIAALCSYEAERKMMAKETKKFRYNEVSEKRISLLQFNERDGRLTGMPLMTMIYPCLTLASEVNLLAIASELVSENKLASADEIEARVAERIRYLLGRCGVAESDARGRGDESWYWASLALLDRHFHKDSISNWLTETSGKHPWHSMVKSRNEGEGSAKFVEHVDMFRSYFNNPWELGRPPDDLIEVLTKTALASPAVTALRSFAKILGTGSLHSAEGLSGSAKIALGFRTLYSLPETMGLIRQQNNQEPYWLRTLEYGVNGNLQAVLDEYFHIMYESLGLMGKPAGEAAGSLTETIASAVSLRTTISSFDEIKINKNNEIKLKRKTLRCRYALAFGEARNEEDGEKTREEQVRTAFNSPFKPFILATTSIGQEGLDFHQYCHCIYHWNLPSNPVDLEQREGRIHRYKGHVIRKNIAKQYGLPSVDAAGADPWQLLFSLAREEHEDVNELIPYWLFDTREGYKIERFIPLLPMCREQATVEDLKKTLALYRMVFGQPRQEDLANYLKAVLKPEELQRFSTFQIDLSPRQTNE